MVRYPPVADEFHTMRMVAHGYSLARIGDGELKMSQGHGYARERGSPKLGSELTQVIRHSHWHCLVGIPTYDPRGPKYQNWLRHQPRFLEVLEPGKSYFSAFISRPDSAPWIRCKEYADLVESVWRGKRVVVVAEKDGSTLKTVSLRAGKVKHINCPSHEAYARVDEFEDRILRARPDVVVMSCGPTATCLANRLAVESVHALDLGSAGGWLGALLA